MAKRRKREDMVLWGIIATCSLSLSAAWHVSCGYNISAARGQMTTALRLRREHRELTKRKPRTSTVRFALRLPEVPSECQRA
jgi:hypothetical protein